MKTTLYLVRPAAPGGSPQGPALTRAAVRCAELTRDFLAVRPVDACYSSPEPHAVQTAAVLAAAHGLQPHALANLGGADDVPGTATRDDEAFADLERRVLALFEVLLDRHQGDSVLVVAPHEIQRALLAGLMNLPAAQAERLRVDRCGISVVVRDGGRLAVTTLNASFHLQGIAA